MKKFAIFFAISTIFISCNTSSERFNAEENLGFAVGYDKYVILIKSKENHSNVYREVMKRATRLAKLNGYHYFKILNRSDVDILKDGTVIERQFANENLEQGYFEKKDLEPAYKVTVRYYKRKPFFSQVIDVCRYSRWLQIHS